MGIFYSSKKQNYKMIIKSKLEWTVCFLQLQSQSKQSFISSYWLLLNLLYGMGHISAKLHLPFSALIFPRALKACSKIFGSSLSRFDKMLVINPAFTQGTLVSSKNKNWNTTFYQVHSSQHSHLHGHLVVIEKPQVRHWLTIISAMKAMNPFHYQDQKTVSP